MPIKTKEIVTDALEDLIVQADEARIEQSEAKAAIRYLNDMMAMWAAQGIEIGYTEVSDLADIVTIPLGAKVGVKANLSIFLSPKYDVDPSAALVARAKAGFSAIVDLAVGTASAAFPSTLPRGSGNDYPDFSDSTFYPDEEDTILTETGGAIALEDDTEEA